MNDGYDDRSIRFARWWVRRYTAGLPIHESATRRAEIDSDLAEHAQCRELDGWTPKQIGRERLRRVVRGMAADLSWRHELVTTQGSLRGLLRVSVTSVTSLAAITLAMYWFAFAAYMLGATSLVEQPFLGGFENYREDLGSTSGMVSGLVLAALGSVLLLASLARPISPVIANLATVVAAFLAVLFFWLGIWPIGIVAILGSVCDLATRIPDQTRPT